MPIKLNLPDIPEAERTPAVDTLLGVIEQLVQENSGQAETIQQLRDEIAVLKGEKPKPQFKPSGMDEKAGTDSEHDDDSGTDGDCAEGDSSDKKRPGSQKRHNASTGSAQERKISPFTKPRLSGHGARFLKARFSRAMTILLSRIFALKLTTSAIAGKFG